MHETFHFIQPLWLLALIPLLALLWRLLRPGGADNPWSRIVDAQLLPVLMAGKSRSASRALPWLLATGWSIAVLALADPTWERQPQPIYQTSAARVIVLDLSRSMNAPDLQPSRLARARYKVEDILARAGEGQTGLVVFAGDAFTVSPLTRDVNTIRALLKAVDTGIMPVQGSRADLGLLKAGELLHQAGLGSGDVLLITDGVDRGDAGTAEDAAAQLRKSGYRVSVLGVGTEAGAPVPDDEGGLLRDAAGKVVLPRLETVNLQTVARAGGGAYRQIGAGNDDIDALLVDSGGQHAQSAAKSELKIDKWKESGPLLAVLLLPLAALAFRRGWMLSVVLLAGMIAPPPPAYASSWDNLWLRAEQQAARALAAKDYAMAAELAADPARRGSAEYKRGNYQQALDGFTLAGGVDADYNRGNALAKLGRYQEAIAAYDRALKAMPDLADARANKAAVEAMLKKQQPNSEQSAPQQNDGKTGEHAGQQGAPENGQPPKGGQDDKQNSASAASLQPQKKAGGGSSAQSKAGDNKGAQNDAPSGQPRDSNAQSGKDQQAAKSEGGNGQQAAKDSAAGRQSKMENQFAQAAKALDTKAVDAAERERNQPAAAGARDTTERQAAAAREGKPGQGSGASGEAEALGSEERLAADQWLRRIPDDPGGLLRRKFRFQYKEREQRADTGSQQSW